MWESRVVKASGVPGLVCGLLCVRGVSLIVKAQEVHSMYCTDGETEFGVVRSKTPAKPGSKTMISSS